MIETRKLEYWIERIENSIIPQQNLDAFVLSVEVGNSTFDKLKNEYSSDDIGNDGILVRQMVHFHVLNGIQYKLLWNSMSQDKQTDYLSLKEVGKLVHYSDELINTNPNEVLVEFRLLLSDESCPLIASESLSSHSDMLIYLTKDEVSVLNGFGMRNVDSFEIDEDRGVYVIYLEAKEEDRVRTYQ